MFLESYNDFDVTNTVPLILWSRKQFLIMISDKYRNSLVDNISESLDNI